MPDAELYSNLLSLYNKSNDAILDPYTLERLAEQLQLVTICDLTQESLALHEMVFASGGDPGESIEKMSMLLKKIKDFVQTQNPEMGTRSDSKPFLLDGKPKVPIVPDDFRCPISLELMKDPVIVATGQVSVELSVFFYYYERLGGAVFALHLQMIFLSICRLMSGHASKSGWRLAMTLVQKLNRGYLMHH